MVSYQNLDVQPLAGALGAELFGVDLSQPLANSVFAAIHQAFHDHLVIFFRDQTLTSAQHRDFAQRFGKLTAHPFVDGLDGFPEIIEIVKEPTEKRNWGGPWHADVTFQKEPSNGSVLYAKEVPANGGDTLFANMYLAYETLSDGMRGTLDGLEAVHVSDVPDTYYGNHKSMREKDGGAEGLGSTAHPVVRTHPETGRKGLFVNRGYTRHFKGMTQEESAPLLNYLFDHATRPEFTCRFHWQPNSIAIWDNRVVLHHPVDDDFSALRGETGYQRIMHRATLAGEKPV